MPSLTVVPGSLSKRSVLVRNTGRSRSSTWRAFGTGFITRMNTWEKSYCSSIDPPKRRSSSQHRCQRDRLTLRRGRLQAVKRNIERFPPDFMFQLSKVEFENLKSQIVTSNWGGF